MPLIHFYKNITCNDNDRKFFTESPIARYIHFNAIENKIAEKAMKNFIENKFIYLHALDDKNMKYNQKIEAVNNKLIEIYKINNNESNKKY